MISNDLLKNKILDAAIHGKLVDNDLSLPSVDVEEITEDIPFDVPSNWKWVEFKQIIDVRDGTHDSPKYISLSEYPLITSKNLKDNHIDFRDVKYLRKEDYDKINLRSKVDDGDVLFAMIGSVGNPVIVRKDREFAIKNVALFKCGSSILNTFLFYYLLSQGDMKVSTKGGVQKFVPLNTLRTYKLPLPPLEQQQRIVIRIEELFELIDRKTKNDQEKNKLKTLLKDKILDSAIHSELIDNDSSLPSVDVEGITKDIPFEIPSNWRWLKLKDCTNFNIGKTPPTKDSSYWSNDVPWVSISDMKHRKFINSTSRSISSKAYSKVFDKKIVPAGTLLMSFKLTIGRLSVTNIECVHNEAIVSLYPKEYLLRDYLLNALDGLDLEKNVKSAIKGKTLNSKSIAEIMIPIPPLEEQQQIVTIIEECFDLVDRL